jgi:hypothetical protein
VSRKESFKIFHAISWNIFNIFICHVELIYDMEKYFTPCHEINFHITCVIGWGINNYLLILNILSFLMQLMLQISRALDNIHENML